MEAEEERRRVERGNESNGNSLSFAVVSMGEK